MKIFISVCICCLGIAFSLQAGEGHSHDHADHGVEHAEMHDVTAEPGKIAQVAKKFGVSWPTLIAQMINFILVAVVLYHFAIKPILATVEERQKKIANGLQFEEEMRVKMLKADEELAEKFKDASQEAQKLMGEAREQSKVLMDQKIQEATQQAENLIRKAGEATELERQKMLAELRQEVARLVVATSAKVLEKEMTAEDKERFSNAAAQSLSPDNS